MKYRYHIKILFSPNEVFYHGFNSDSEILEMAEIRSELDRKGKRGDFFVDGIFKTINN